MNPGTGQERRLPWDWYAGSLPANIDVDETAYIETAHSFLRFRSLAPVGARFGRGASMYKTSMLDVGARGRVIVGDYALLQGVRIVCDSTVSIGDYAMLSWSVLLIDCYRCPADSRARRAFLETIAASAHRELDADAEARPIQIGRNAWIGFDACILPGVTIGEGAIVGARSVVRDDVEPFTIVAGNPARMIRRLDVA